MKYIITGCIACLFFLAAVTSLSAQNKDSVLGDFEALQALYNSTQGDDLPVLGSPSELPPHDSATYPYMYMINGELWWVKMHKEGGTVEWRNAGAPWKDKTGWEGITPETMGDAVGIEVDSDGRVIEIDMQKVTTVPHPGGGRLTAGNNLVGFLPPEIGNLKKLKKINIKQNFFYGELPAQIGLMKSLERLSLAGHHWEVDLNNKRLWLEGAHTHVNRNDDPFTFSVREKDVVETNRFRSNLPPEIGNLTNLDLLELSHQFLTGSYPSEWGKLKNLRGLLIDVTRDTENSLYGELPTSWGNMTNMVYFRMTGHLTRVLTGKLPSGMLDWNNLVNFAVYTNNLMGDFPRFTNLKEMFYFNISRNNFSGEFPWTSIFNGNNSSLNKFNISSNNFTGELPKTVPDAKFPIKRAQGRYAIAAFGASYNNFEGSVPEWTTSMIGQMTYDISYNNFSGNFPHGLETNRSLKTLRIHGNNFSGPLPDVEWATRQMNWFQIFDNNFEGEIPESWVTLFQDENGEWRSGQVFQFQGNCLSGRIPDWGKYVDIDAYVYSDNCYSFKDIGPVYEELNSAGIGFYVEGQKPFGSKLNRTMPLGYTAVFDLSEFDYEGNEYQWLKDDQPISGETDPVLTIQNVDESDEGSYRLEVTNSSMPELGTQTSQPIIFELGADDGLNGGNTNGGASGSVNFPSAPTLYGPFDDSENVPSTPEFSWSDIGADYYLLHVSRRNPTGMQIDVIVEDTTYTPDEILDDSTIYDWRVRGVKDAELGEWSEIYKFTTGEAGLPQVAELIAPAQFADELNLRPKLVWEDVTADLYQVRLKISETDVWMIEAEDSDSNYRLTEDLEPETGYVWQVKSIKDGVEGAWGPQWKFSTGIYDYSVEAPSLLAPVQGSEYENLIPTFEWENVNADTYTIVVMRDTSTNAKVMSGMEGELAVINDETTETIYTPSNPLDPEAVYYWQVQAVVDGAEGEWSEIWEFKTPEEQQVVSIRPDEQPVVTSLDQNYPNPFNPTTQVEFTLSEMQEVSIKVYDMAGRQVATLFEGIKQAGRHSATFDASSLSSGIYIYRFMSDSHQFSRKMTLIK